MKLLPVIAAAVLAVPSALIAPVKAAGIHDFDGSTPTTLDGQCYTAANQSKVCFRRINGETYAMAVNDVTNPVYPHIMTVNCGTGRYDGFGPLSNESAANWAFALCDTGRY